MATEAKLPPGIRWDSVSLTVADVHRSVEFYTQRLGLTLLDGSGGEALLGSAGSAFLKLVERPGARHVKNTTGLFHFAILVPSRDALAKSLRRLVATRTPLQGASDHLVSEALYLADPDGNGIEIYRDRMRTEWRWEDGQIAMATEPLDLEALLSESNDSDGVPAGTVLGHMHLHVARIPAAERFYREVVGFDLTTRYGPTASFLSANGYHHHLGINTWAGLDAPRPPHDAAGLIESTLAVGNDAVEVIAARAGEAGVAVERDARGILLRDPSGNALRIVPG